jgi:hypothetical protein
MVAVVLLGIHLAGCSSWRVEQVSPAQLLSERGPVPVRIVRSDGSRLVLEQPKVSGDSLSGFSDGRRRAVPLRDVNSVATRHGDVGKSVLVGLGIVGGAFAIAAIGYAASNPCYIGCR